MNLKQITLATASITVCLSAFAGGMNEPSYEAPQKQTKRHHNWMNGWYIGAGPNWDATMSSKLPTPALEWDNSQSDYDADSESFKKTDNDVGFDVYVGYDFGKFFAFEMGYTMVGQQNFKSTAFVDTCEAESCTQTAKVDQWNVHGVGLLKWPMGNYFDVFAKAGVAYYQNTTDFDGGFSETFDNPNAELSTFALTYGAGIELKYDHYGIRGEYVVISPNESDRENFYISDIVGASVFYRF